jgi:hypothetical protein
MFPIQQHEMYSFVYKALTFDLLRTQHGVDSRKLKEQSQLAIHYPYVLRTNEAARPFARRPAIQHD